MTTRRGRRRELARTDAGTISLGFVVVAPALVLFIAMAVLAGRITMAHGSVTSAANEAARAASTARSAGDADTRAQEAATSTLTNSSLTCSTTAIETDVSGFHTPPGTPSSVSVTVTCVVPLSDLGVPGAPGSKTISSTGTSVLDLHMARS